MMDAANSLCKNLKQLMDQQQINSANLSKATGIPKSTISSYLSGEKASYAPEHLLSLSSFFEVTIDFLLSGQESDFALLNTLKTEGLFEGWLKVRIERAVPSKSTVRRKG
ncbi:MAG: helix-turn-helix transcriptional regulator [Bdellovibrionales bacterium]|nr:helix-turn-helix transcriptional regulator [Bdellovibrionales bacterium]